MGYAGGYAAGYAAGSQSQTSGFLLSIAGVAFENTENPTSPTTAIIENTLEIEDELAGRTLASFDVETDLSRTIQRGEDVLIQQDGIDLFAGLVLKPTRAYNPASGLLTWQVVAADWHILADRRRYTAAFTATAAGTIVNDIITNLLAAEGITAGTIITGPTLDEVIFNYTPASTALDLLAEEAAAEWWIDTDKALHFKQRGNPNAPVVFGWEHVADQLPRLDNNAPLYRNRQIMRGGTDRTDEQTEAFIGDGTNQSFALAYPVAFLPSSITVDLVAKTIGVRGVHTGRDWYYQKGSNIISQDAAGTPLTAAQTLRVTYRGEYPFVLISDDGAEINRLQILEGGSSTGIYEHVTDENYQTRKQAIQSAGAKLARYATNAQKLALETTDTGFRAGQIMTVDLPELGLESVDFLIRNVTTRQRSGILFLTLDCIRGPAEDTWFRLFSSFASPDRTIRENIDSETILGLLESVSEAWTWAESVTTTAQTCELASLTTLVAASGVLVC